MLENKMEKEYMNVSDVGYKEKRGSGNDTVKRLRYRYGARVC